MTMRNPASWDVFCQRFDELLPKYLKTQHHIIHRFIDHDVFDDSPNILFYHAEGFPINMLLDYMFRQKYGEFTRHQCQISSDLEYYQTQHFIEFDFHHPNFQKQSDECIDLLKQIVKNPSVCGGRHIIVLKNIDGAIMYSKQTFRVLLERFSKYAVFVCTTAHVSKMEAPLRSRFMMVRVPLPSSNELNDLLAALDLPQTSCASVNTGNIYKALLIADIVKHNTHEDTEVLCKFNFPMVGQTQIATASFETLRTLANKICQTNIPFRGIVLDLLLMIKNDSSKMDFIMDAADIEHQLACTNGGRQILYVEMLLHRARFHMKNI